MIACTLMPNHVHLLVEIEAGQALPRFARVLSAFRRREARNDGAADAASYEWEPLPPAEKVQRDRRHLARTIRYVHLNPCRDALCRDPLEWEWSTHRDWTGTVARSAVDVRRWARLLGWSSTNCAARMHAYVASDSTVPSGSILPDPRSLLAGAVRDVALIDIETSVPIVLRSARRESDGFGLSERRVSLAAAARWTKYRAPELARWLGCDATTARRRMRGVVRAADKDAKTRDSAVEGPERPGPAAEGPRRDAGDQRGVPRSGAARSGMSKAEEWALALTLSDARLRGRGPRG